MVGFFTTYNRCNKVVHRFALFVTGHKIVNDWRWRNYCVKMKIRICLLTMWKYFFFSSYLHTLYVPKVIVEFICWQWHETFFRHTTYSYICFFWKYTNINYAIPPITMLCNMNSKIHYHVHTYCNPPPPPPYILYSIECSTFDWVHERWRWIYYSLLEARWSAAGGDGTEWGNFIINYYL